MYIQKISADLSSNICSGNWNTQIRQVPEVGTAEQICILHATKSPISHSTPGGGRKGENLLSAKGRI